MQFLLVSAIRRPVSAAQCLPHEVVTSQPLCQDRMYACYAVGSVLCVSGGLRMFSLGDQSVNLTFPKKPVCYNFTDFFFKTLLYAYSLSLMF